MLVEKPSYNNIIDFKYNNIYILRLQFILVVELSGKICAQKVKVLLVNISKLYRYLNL